MSGSGLVDPIVAVVVLNWNGCADTLDCINSLEGCTYSATRVYVVDNGSDDESLKVLRPLSRVGKGFSLIEVGCNLGFSGGNNVGIRQAVSDGADYVMLLNNDTVVDPDFIQPLVDMLTQHADVGVVTSKIYFAYPSKRVWFFGGYMDRNRGIGGPMQGQHDDVGQYQSVVDCDYATGCVLMTRAEVFAEIGLLDDAYFYLCEDADFCFRVSDAGYRVVAVGASVVWHKVSASMSNGEESPLRLYFRARNQLLLVRKNRKNYRVVGDKIWMIYFHLRYLLKRCLTGRSTEGSIYYMRGLFDYLRGRFGPLPRRSGRAQDDRTVA